jgi:RNA 3'-terminal phosphate cyclase (ATP)
MRLKFQPGEIRSGRYKFDIGTAGATSLVLQTIFLPLSLAHSASTVIITGGTHVPWSPVFHYLDLHWLPYMLEIGFDARLSLEAGGFYPQGGGRLSATIRPAGELSPLRLSRRGNLHSIRGLSAVSNLDISIADRQKRQALRRLEGYSNITKIKSFKMPAHSKGTFLLLLAEFEHSRCCYSALGELGKPAERVADEAVDALESFLKAGAASSDEGTADIAIDQHLADQLLLPLSFAGGASEFTTNQVTAHLQTNANIIQAFSPVKIDIQGDMGQPGKVRIIPA